MQLQLQYMQWIVSAGNCHMISQDRRVWKCAFLGVFWKQKTCLLFDSSTRENSKRMEQLDWKLSLQFRSWLEVDSENVCQMNATLLSAICRRQYVWNVQGGQFRVFWMSMRQFWTKSCSWWEASGVAWGSAWYGRSSSIELRHEPVSEFWTRWSLEM